MGRKGREVMGPGPHLGPEGRSQRVKEGLGQAVQRPQEDAGGAAGRPVCLGDAGLHRVWLHAASGPCAGTAQPQGG